MQNLNNVQIKIGLAFFMIFFLRPMSVTSQLIYSGPIYDDIAARVTAQYGPIYKLQDVYGVDALVGRYYPYPSPHAILDPYGTLADHYIFTAKGLPDYSNPKGFVGLYRDGQIVWQSDTLITTQGNSGVGLFCTAELNNDGEVDLVIQDHRVARVAGEKFLWIFSWDGFNGRLISDIDSDEQSPIVSLTGVAVFELVDVDGDGIMEIQGTWYEENDPEERLYTYSWNGQLYGYWPGTPQPNPDTFLPRDRIDVEIRVFVSQIESGYRYNYHVKNLSTSIQDINEFSFSALVDSVTAVNKRPGWSFFRTRDLFRWNDYHNPATGYKAYFIRKDESDSSFTFESTGLPTLLNYYVRGFNYSPHGQHIPRSDIYNNIFENSVTGLTIGPMEPPSPLDSIAFLDTLISYKHQAFELGWIKNQKVVKHLDKIFEHAKKRLEKGSIPRAIKALRASVKRVETRKKRHLTSEAYALLRFNTEYLIDQLLDPDKIISVPLQFSTIQAAVNASQAGNIIEVSPGVYDELVKINKKNSIVLRTTGGLDEVTVNGFMVSRSHNVTIEGFVVDASKTRKDGIMLEGGNSDIILEANVVKNSGKNHSGIVVSGDNPRTRIVNNRVHSNSANGIYFKKAKGGPHYVVNNTIVHNGRNGVHVARKQAIYLVNNIVSFNGTSPGKKGGHDGYGVLRAGKRHSGQPENITLLNNLIVGNHGRETSESSLDIGNYAQVLDATDRGNLTTSGTEGDGVSASPTAVFADIFVSETPIDLHLQESSVAIDIGLDDYSPPDSEAGAIPMLDFDGEIRPSEEAVDVGADERK